MCANFGLEKRIDTTIELPPETPIGDYYPKSTVAVIRSTDAVLMRWGLVPFWSPEPSVKYATHNARSEKAASSPAFRAPFKARRCLIPATHFYEWQQSSPKVRFRFGLAADEPIYFAGLWDQWGKADDDKILSCTIMTTDPNSTLEQFHDRMPVILRPADVGTWLDPSTSSADLQSLLTPYSGEMTVREAPRR
jgi:putative SOS response-associated peptidase YedK